MAKLNISEGGLGCGQCCWKRLPPSSSTTYLASSLLRSFSRPKHLV